MIEYSQFDSLIEEAINAFATDVSYSVAIANAAVAAERKQITPRTRRSRTSVTAGSYPVGIVATVVCELCPAPLGG